MAGNPKTLFEKVWESHVVVEPANEPVLLYIDLHLIHEVTSPQAFEGLAAGWAEGAAAGSLHRDRGPQRAHHGQSPRHRGSDRGQAD